MGKLGSDWVYIGLAVGAVYAVYKLTKPVSDTTAGVGTALTNATTSASNVIGSAGSGASTLISTAVKDVTDLNQGIKNAIASAEKGVTDTLAAGSNFLDFIGNTAINSLSKPSVSAIKTVISSVPTANVSYSSIGYSPSQSIIDKAYSRPVTNITPANVGMLSNTYKQDVLGSSYSTNDAKNTNNLLRIAKGLSPI